MAMGAVIANTRSRGRATRNASRRQNPAAVPAATNNITPSARTIEGERAAQTKLSH
jgi:hypothetical protein